MRFHYEPSMPGQSKASESTGDRDAKDRVGVATHDSNQSGKQNALASSPATGGVRRTVGLNYPTGDLEGPSAGISTPQPSNTTSGKHWWLLAALSALLLTGLTVAAVYLVTKKPSTVDQLVILTVPSGAEIRLDSKDYGHSPVKIERLKIGTYALAITKEGFESVEESIAVTESGPIEFKLKPVAPSEAADIPPEDLIKRYQQRAEESFARGYYGLPYDGSARNYADLILFLDSNNAFATEMRERVRRAAHQQAQSAIAREDLAQAQEIYRFLVEYYPYDEDARIAAAKLEGQLSDLKGKVRDLVRKAEEAFQAGRLAEPNRSSAYYYSKQALAIERQNDRARQIRNQVKEMLAASAEEVFARGEIEAAVKQLEHVSQLFPEDKQSRIRLRELQTTRPAEAVKTADPKVRRLKGLEAYQNEKFAQAIPDLEAAVLGGQSSTEVVFDLARSHMRVGHLDQAESYFLKVSPTSGDPYKSAIAALGDIAFQRGDKAAAVERYKEARQLGGSTMYTVAILEDKIESIERRQREKAAEPTPLAIQVKHLHGGLLKGSCSGTLSISSTGVRYDGSEHTYSYTVAGVEVRITREEMIIQFRKDAQKFKVAVAAAERFQETLVRYKQTHSSSNN